MIEYRLIPLNRALVFQVLALDDKQRRIDGGVSCRNFDADVNTRVVSKVHPEIQFDLDSGRLVICVPGSDRNQDNHVSVVTFGANDERDETIQRIHNALTAWTAVGGFCREEETTLNNCGDYTFRL